MRVHIQLGFRYLACIPFHLFLKYAREFLKYLLRVWPVSMLQSWKSNLFDPNSHGFSSRSKFTKSARFAWIAESNDFIELQIFFVGSANTFSGKRLAHITLQFPPRICTHQSVKCSSSYWWSLGPNFPWDSINELKRGHCWPSIPDFFYF